MNMIMTEDEENLVESLFEMTAQERMDYIGSLNSEKEVEALCDKLGRYERLLMLREMHEETVTLH